MIKMKREKSVYYVVICVFLFLGIVFVYSHVKGNDAINQKVNNDSSGSVIDRDKIKSQLNSIRCVNCKENYAYEEKLQFDIESDWNEAYGAVFGIKILTNNGWKLLTDTTLIGQSEGWGKAIIYLVPKRITTIYWNKKIIASLQDELPKDSAYVYIDLTKGARLMLFVWDISPFKHGLQKNVHEFTLLPKNVEHKTEGVSP